MSNFTTCRNFYPQLKKLIELPEGVSKLVLTMEANKVVQVEITQNAISRGEEVTKQYKLVEVE